MYQYTQYDKMAVDKHILKNGMVVLGEPMEAVGSVAFGLMLPAGAAMLPEGCCGAANIVADWIFRGAGDKNSRLSVRSAVPI
jgi:predicted Zn-dependent peptidase